MGREITTAEVLDLLASLGTPVKAPTWRAYVARGQAPAAVRRVGREPLYDEDEVRRWSAGRPGQGARTDRRKHVITTEYGTWGDVGESTVTVEEYVAGALGEHGEGYDVAALAADFRKAVNEALPEGVTLNGNLFFGPHDVAAEDRPDLREVVDSVDFWEIAGRHDRAH
jgi:hypothetical protein